MILKLKKLSITFWLICFCIFTLTLGQFLPIYFVEAKLAYLYYAVVLICLLVSVAILISKNLLIKKKRNVYFSWITGSVISLAIVSVFIVIRFIGSLAIWQDATVLYTKKNDSRIKIITRYIDEGAFGGGTAPDDYEIVIKRPIFSILKIETKVDTNGINKSDWVKKVYDRYDTNFDTSDK